MRPIDREVRARVGLPRIRRRKQSLRYAVLVVIAAGGLALWGKPRLALAVLLVGLGFAPAVDWWTRTEARRREAIYRSGTETVGRIIEVEPSGSGRRDHVVRVEFFVGKRRVEAKVIGAPLARRGIGPGDDVLLIYDPDEPAHCLLLDRVARTPPPAPN